MKKLLLLSGKGGTGKTTTAAAFLRFANAKAAADCDVDAPNLHLVSDLPPQPEVTAFFGGDKAVIDADKCVGCGLCAQTCRFHALTKNGDVYRVDEFSCEGCGVCAYVCPQGAVTLQQDMAGEQRLYRRSDSVFSTAMLKMGRGNSGKLVSHVKSAMAQKAPECPLAIIDGSPGIGCPVIASLSGVDLALLVAEPSLSGISDLKRLIHSASIFHTAIAVCVNKWDTSPANTAAIEAFCTENQLPFVGKIPYDKSASAAINEGKSLADTDCPARDALYEIFVKTSQLLGI